jgi:hypothetical protein
LVLKKFEGSVAKAFLVGRDSDVKVWFMNG